MRNFLFCLFVSTIALSLHARVEDVDCGGGMPLDQKSQCALKQAITTASNDQIVSQVQSLLTSGYVFIDEVKSVPVSVECPSAGPCRGKYLASALFYNGVKYQSLLALIQVSNTGIPVILKVVNIDGL